MSFGSTVFGEVGELTPPSSAHRSPSPLSALFKEPTKKLAPESVEIIETTILDSIVSNPALPEFSTLCELVRRQMHAGKFRSLRDVEKDLWFRGQVSLRSFLSFSLSLVPGSHADDIFRWWRPPPALASCSASNP